MNRPVSKMHTRYRHNYNEILVGTYALLKSVISNNLE